MQMIQSLCLVISVRIVGRATLRLRSWPAMSADKYLFCLLHKWHYQSLSLMGLRDEDIVDQGIDAFR